MFIGCSGFLVIDIADLVIRLQVTFAESPNLSLEKKLAKADRLTKPLMWIGQMLFIFLVCLVQFISAACLTKGIATTRRLCGCLEDMGTIL
jgi:hypothetical protein